MTGHISVPPQALREPSPSSQAVIAAPVITQTNYAGRCYSLVETTWTRLKELFFRALGKIIECLEALKTSLTPARGHSSTIAARFGYGIKNGGNSCYISAVVQALRFTPLPSLLSTKTAPLSESGTAFLRLVGKLRRTAQAEEINGFRQLMRRHGFRTTSRASQEDASQFCQFLLDAVGFQPIQQKVEVFHQAGLTVPSLDRGRVVENHIQLGLGRAVANSELKDLALSSLIMEEVEAAKIASQSDINQGEECRQALREMKPLEEIPTLQSIQLEEGKIPELLPIFIKRFEFDAGLQQMTKLKTRILPSPTIDFPLTNHPTKKARFVLCSVVVHSGTSAKQGHYYTYVPKEIEGRRAYLEYNDSTVRLHRNPATVLDDVAENGYLYFYRHC